MWRKFKPFMSDDAIRYHTMKDELYNSIYGREQLIQEILKRIDINIVDLASKSLSELETILGRIMGK